MMTFDGLVERVLEREGGYTNHKNDRGGATKYGITQLVYTSWLASHGKQSMDVRDLTREEAKAIYLELYWNPARTEDLPPAVRDIHFDAAVNHGVGRAAKLLQEAALVRQDGEIGQFTMAAVHRMHPELLRARYVSARYKFYGQIINSDRSQLAFIAGWMNRMREFA